MSAFGSGEIHFSLPQLREQGMHGLQLACTREPQRLFGLGVGTMAVANPLHGVGYADWWPFPCPIPLDEHPGVHLLLILRQRLALIERLPVDDLSVVVPRHTRGATVPEAADAL